MHDEDFIAGRPPRSADTVRAVVFRLTAPPDAATAELAGRLHATGVPTALVTSGGAMDAAIDGADAPNRFTVRVDDTGGQTASSEHPPNSTSLLAAARRLHADPARTVVIVDEHAAADAAVAAGFGLVVASDRGHRDHPTWDPAVVLADPAQLDLSEVLAGEGAQPAAASAYPGHTWCGGASAAVDGWLLRYEDFDSAQEGTREALCTLGNGYWATRGSAPASVIDETHYPGTYFAGVYNRVLSPVEGRSVESEHMVNAPDWTFVSVQPAAGARLYPGSAEMIGHRQHLDLRRGVLTRSTRYRDSMGRITRVTSRHLHSMSSRHLAAIAMTVEAENWTGEVLIRSAINGDVSNKNAADDAPLTHRHLMIGDVKQVDPDTVLLEVRTNQSHIGIATAARTRVRRTKSPASPTGRFFTDGPVCGHDFVVAVEPGAPLSIEKVAAAVTSRDRAISTPGLAASERIHQAPGFDELLDDHIQTWQQHWARFGIDIHAGARQRLALNLHIFHTLQTVAAADPDLDAGVPARGLHGEGYRGHIFWDELFVYPLLTLRRPELTRSLLLYRYRRLAHARAAARTHGLAGAMFPWQSGSDGREETPTELFNLRNEQWMPDNSHRQRHVGLAVAYSVWQYYQATGDVGFLVDYGAEMLVEVARFFASIADHDVVDDRFNITGVMGPDEFHDGYPEAPGMGLRNNTYTNVLVSWMLSRAADTVRLLPTHDCAAVLTKLAVSGEELALWDRISQRLRVAFHDGVISQFEGYERLAEFDWDRYRRRYGNIGRLDLILQAEGDSTNNYKLSKQADVLMLFYLFSAEELRAIFTRLGYELPKQLIPRTVHYYLSRSSHGSTLSRLVHSWVTARTDRVQSWSLFAEALESDLSDTQGGTTRTGIHLGAMAGTADMVIRCYGGVETRDDVLRLHPLLPHQLRAASFRLRYRGQPIDVEIAPSHVVLQLQPCAALPIRVCLEDVTRTLTPGERWRMDLARPTTATAD